MQKTKSYSMPKIMDALHFSHADLEANRQGFMTYAQRIRLRRNKTIAVWGYSLLIVVLICVAAVVYFEMPHSEVMILFLIMGFLVAMVAGLVYYLSNQSHNYNVDLSKGHVLRMEGMLTTRRVLRTTGKTFYYDYYLVIQSEQFKVSHRVYNAFRSRVYYALYFAPNTRKVLSAEPL